MWNRHYWESIEGHKLVECVQVWAKKSGQFGSVCRPLLGKIVEHLTIPEGDFWIDFINGSMQVVEIERQLRGGDDELLSFDGRIVDQRVLHRRELRDQAIACNLHGVAAWLLQYSVDLVPDATNALYAVIEIADIYLDLSQHRVLLDKFLLRSFNPRRVGIPVTPIIMASLRRQVGLRVAEYLTVMGALLSPQQALQFGLVDELVESGSVVERAIEWCRGFAVLPEAASLTRNRVRADLVAFFEDERFEDDTFTESWFSPSTQEQIRAVVERLGKSGTKRS